VATSGPGGIHLLNGLYDAKLDGQLVLAITGLQFHDLVDTLTQQDVELDKLFIDVCVYNAWVMGANHVENVVELACRTALAYHGVSHTLKQARHVAESLARGTPAAKKIALTIASDTVREII
jgi:pyruvate dehydrogenase (quinone)